MNELKEETQCNMRQNSVGGNGKKKFAYQHEEALLFLLIN